MASSDNTTYFPNGTNTRQFLGVGSNDSAITVTGVTTSDVILSCWKYDTTPAITNVVGTAAITAANTITVTGAATDSNVTLFVLVADAAT
jgi:hypothetical protein